MSFRVRIVKKIWESITGPIDPDAIFLFYGFHAENENCTYLVNLAIGKGKLQDPLQVPLKQDKLDLLGWGFIQPPEVGYVSFENFKVQTHVQDIMPKSVMIIVNPKLQNEIKIMRIKELKLEKVPFTIINEGDRVFDKFLEEQKNLAMFTDSDIFEKKQEYPVTKKDLVTEILDEMKEKMYFLEKHGKNTSDYPDLENALDLAEEGLFGRAGFYLRLVQKKIEDDVVSFRHKDKYEQLLKDMKNDLNSFPSKEIRPDLGDALSRIEQLIEEAESMYYKENYKDAHSKIFRAHEYLLQILGKEADNELIENKESKMIDNDLEPILTLEEFEADVPLFEPIPLGSEKYPIEDYGDIGQKIESLESKKRQDPHNKFILGELGDAYFEAGDIHKALECYKMQLKKTPKNPILLNNIGMIYKLQFNYKSAIDMFKRALENDTTYSEAYYNLGFLMFEEGDLAEAIKNYEKALELNPDLNLARDSLNVARKKREEFMKQQKLFRKEDFENR